jgi:ABC-type uncharacterized transport system permease subunit
MAPATVLPLILSGALASAIVLLFQLQLGYAAAWMGTSAPLFWIWQKLLFVLGGLLIPLEALPHGLEATAKALPIMAVAYAPARLAAGRLLQCCSHRDRSPWPRTRSRSPPPSASRPSG